jgi:iron complex outermembrane receptor protein
VSRKQTLWGAVSRAVRVPTRIERDLSIDASNPASNPILRLLGNPNLESEDLRAYEIGHRWRMPHSVLVDVAAFHNRYTGLSSLEIETPFIDSADGRIVVPIRNENLSDGQTTGAELLGTVSPRQTWRLTATYAYVDVDITTHGMDANRGKFYDGATPRHQFGLRSFLDLPGSFQFDAQLRSLSAVRRLPPVVSGQGIPGYSEMELRLAWHGWRRMELSLVGQNLLHDHHSEFGPAGQRGEIERAVYGKVAWGF